MNNNCWNTGEENRKEKAKASLAVTWVGTAAHIAAWPAGMSRATKRCSARSPFWISAAEGTCPFVCHANCYHTNNYATAVRMDEIA